MSERGVFAVDRGIFDHPLLRGEPYTRVQAWTWLIAEASWKPRRIRVGGTWVQLGRGQTAHSLRHMAKTWQWTEKRVRTFLSRLKSDVMIDTSTDAGITVITICNYNEYQRVSLPKGAPDDAPDDAVVTQQGHNNKDREYKEYSVANATGALAPTGTDLFPEAKPDPVFTDSKHELWAEGPAILASLGIRPDQKARSLIGRWAKDAGDDCLVVLSAIKRARENRVQDPVPWITRAIAAGHGPPGATPQPRTVREQATVNWKNTLDKLGEFARSEPAASGSIGGAATLSLFPPADAKS